MGFRVQGPVLSCSVSGTQEAKSGGRWLGLGSALVGWHLKSPCWTELFVISENGLTLAGAVSPGSAKFPRCHSIRKLIVSTDHTRYQFTEASPRQEPWLTHGHHHNISSWLRGYIVPPRGTHSALQSHTQETSKHVTPTSCFLLHKRSSLLIRW